MSLIDPDEYARQTLARRIDCPVPWCGGSWLDHGGDGAEPDKWIHDDEHGIGLPHGAALFRSQEGTGQVEWSIVIGGQVVGMGSDLQRLALMLGDIARAIRWHSHGGYDS